MFCPAGLVIFIQSKQVDKTGSVHIYVILHNGLTVRVVVIPNLPPLTAKLSELGLIQFLIPLPEVSTWAVNLNRPGVTNLFCFEYQTSLDCTRTRQYILRQKVIFKTRWKSWDCYEEY